MPKTGLHTLLQNHPRCCCHTTLGHPACHSSCQSLRRSGRQSAGAPLASVSRAPSLLCCPSPSFSERFPGCSPWCCDVSSPGMACAALAELRSCLSVRLHRAHTAPGRAGIRSRLFPVLSCGWRRAPTRLPQPCEAQARGSLSGVQCQRAAGRVCASILGLPSAVTWARKRERWAHLGPSQARDHLPSQRLPPPKSPLSCVGTLLSPTFSTHF